jgi:hypothetical protein
MHNTPDEAPATRADLRTAFEHREARIEGAKTTILTALHN